MESIEDLLGRVPLLGLLALLGKWCVGRMTTKKMLLAVDFNVPGVLRFAIPGLRLFHREPPVGKTGGPEGSLTAPGQVALTGCFLPCTNPALLCDRVSL